MRRPIAAVGSAVFFLVGPGTVVGLIPWLLTRWQVREPLPYWAPMRVLGGILLVAGLMVNRRVLVADPAMLRTNPTKRVVCRRVAASGYQPI